MKGLIPQCAGNPELQTVASYLPDVDGGRVLEEDQIRRGKYARSPFVSESEYC